MGKKALILLTAAGEDQTGIVERITRKILENNGNVEQSRMARLGGEFAALVLVAVDTSSVDKLKEAVASIASERLSITSRTLPDRAAKGGVVPYTLQVRGADHEGIIHEFCRLLAESGVNIAEMETSVSNSPISGTPMFAMEATLEIPSSTPLKELRQLLNDLADRVMVDAELTVHGT
jgi:glycine cleavage system transcriptional repressor